jgi:hypothetical protein
VQEIPGWEKKPEIRSTKSETIHGKRGKNTGTERQVAKRAKEERQEWKLRHELFLFLPTLAFIFGLGFVSDFVLRVADFLRPQTPSAAD